MQFSSFFEPAYSFLYIQGIFHELIQSELFDLSGRGLWFETDNQILDLNF